MATSSLEKVARGLLIDALITYVAICQERGYDSDPRSLVVSSWRDACHEHVKNIDDGGPSEKREGKLFDAMIGGGHDDEHLEILINERRGLIRDMMRAELEEITHADASAPPPDSGEVSREVEG